MATPYGGQAVAFDDNEDDRNSLFSDHSRDRQDDDILRTESEASSRHASEAGDGDDLRLSQRLNSYRKLIEQNEGEHNQKQVTNVTTPLGSRARLVRHEFTSLQDTAALLEKEQ